MIVHDCPWYHYPCVSWRDRQIKFVGLSVGLPGERPLMLLATERITANDAILLVSDFPDVGIEVDKASCAMGKPMRKVDLLIGRSSMT